MCGKEELAVRVVEDRAAVCLYSLLTNIVLINSLGVRSIYQI